MSDPAEDRDPLLAVLEELRHVREELAQLRAVTRELMRRRARHTPEPTGAPDLSPERRAMVYDRIMRAKKKGSR